MLPSPFACNTVFTGFTGDECYIWRGAQWGIASKSLKDPSLMLDVNSLLRPCPPFLHKIPIIIIIMVLSSLATDDFLTVFPTSAE